MGRDIFSRIIESIEKKVLDKAINLDKDNFRDINRIDSDKTIAFIDGGQAELLKAVNFSLQFVRVAALLFKNNKKVGSALNEFFILTSAEEDKGGIEYKTEIFPLKGVAIDNIRINALDSSIREGNERASVSKIGGIARRFAELKLASNVIDKLKEGDAIVLDGSLKIMVKGEEKFMESLLSKAEKYNIIISSLAKTNNILSENGACLASQIISLAGERASWYYCIEDEQNHSSCITKLNKSSEHVFEFNIYKKQKENAEEMLSVLAANSNDAAFPGYPYGLVQVDQFARVSNQERDYLLTSFKANAGKKWHRLKLNMNVLNAHEILDNMS